MPSAGRQNHQPQVFGALFLAFPQPLGGAPRADLALCKQSLPPPLPHPHASLTWLLGVLPPCAPTSPHGATHPLHHRSNLPAGTPPTHYLQISWALGTSFKCIIPDRCVTPLYCECSESSCLSAQRPGPETVVYTPPFRVQ